MNVIKSRNVNMRGAQVHRRRKFIGLNCKMLVIKAGIHQMLVRIPNREDPDQTASSEAVSSGSALFA